MIHDFTHLPECFVAPLGAPRSSGSLNRPNPRFLRSPVLFGDVSTPPHIVAGRSAAPAAAFRRTVRLDVISDAATTSLNYVASERSRTLHCNEHSGVAKYMGMEGRDEVGKGWK